MSARIKSFILGGITAVIIFIFGILLKQIGFFSILAVLSFTLVSCLILKNNFIGDMILEVFSWGFVKMPGLIFTLDLDGLIWLLTVKLLFWIIGFVLAAVCGILAIVLGLVVSLFVYPFALCKDIRENKASQNT